MIKCHNYYQENHLISCIHVFDDSYILYFYYFNIDKHNTLNHQVNFQQNGIHRHFSF